MSRTGSRLQGDADCNSRAARIPAVIQVVAIVGVQEIHVVGLVPIVSPVFGIRIHDTEPIAAVLEARVPVYLQERQAVDVERVPLAVVTAEIDIRNVVSVVAAALLPGTVLRFEITGATMLPRAMLFAFLRTPLFRRTLYLCVLRVTFLLRTLPTLAPLLSLM